MRKLESYIKEYGRIEGTKMYRRLQREAALASGHARQKKKLAAAVELGKKGGEARAQNLSKEELSKIGKDAAAKRWGEKAEGKKS
jgi:hypothetical protein